MKVVLFQLSGRGNLHDDATPKVIPDPNSYILGLSNEVLTLILAHVVHHIRAFKVWQKKSILLEKQPRFWNSKPFCDHNSS